MSANYARNEYLQVKILDRVCYVARNDFRIISGLSGNVTGVEAKVWSELPDDASIVQVLLFKKRGSTRKLIS